MTNALPSAPTRVLVSHEQHAEMAVMLRELRAELDVRDTVPADVTPDDLNWAEAYLGFRPPPSRASDGSMGNVRWVHSTGAGVDPWLYPHEISRDILITRSSESFGPMIAEWAITRALMISQRVREFAQSQANASWEKRELSLLRGTNAVVVGTGDVGAHVGRLFRALGCHVHGISRSGSGDREIFHALSRIDSLRDVVSHAAWLIVMLPLTAETHHLIGRDVLSHCRNAVVINAGRGPVVDESVLPDALANGWLRGAALDVFEVEPLPKSSPLWSDARVIVSPHISGLTTVAGAVHGFVDCLEALQNGRVPRWVVPRDRQY